MRIPEFWETLLKRYVKRTFYADTRKKGFAEREEFTEGDYRFFAKGVAELNLGFTRERTDFPKNYLNRKELRSGYLLYFLPVNALKIASLLDQLPPRHFLEGEWGNLKILDVGSGPGTGMLGTFLYLQTLLKNRRGGKLQLEWVLIDQNREALKDAASLYEEVLEQFKKELPSWVIDSKIRFITADLRSQKISRVLADEQADLILSLNFLSELPREKRLAVVEILLRKHLRPKGKILIMEPALQMTTRDLMELHDELIQRESAHIYAPCLHQSACPMLRMSHRDWCHTYIPWERPVWIEKIDRLVEIRKDYLKCSCLILGKEPVNAIDFIKKEERYPIWRVVSGFLNSKGKSERLLCGEAALPDLLRITRLDRDQSELNQGFDQAQRGDIVQAPETPRITRETPFHE